MHVLSVIVPFFLLFLLCFCFVFILSLEHFVDVPLIFSCPADHVPGCQPRIFMVEARSVNVKNTTTITYVYRRVQYNRVRLPILLVVSWTGKRNTLLSPFGPENLVSRDRFGCPVPRFLPLYAVASICSLYGHTRSCQSRVYRITRLRTDGVLCRQSAGTGPPVVLKVVPVIMGAAAFAGITMDQ